MAGEYLMQFSPKEYLDLKSDPLPYTTQWEFTITETKGSCPICKKPLTHIKQMINEYDNFVFIRPAGLCNNCKLVVSTYPFKITDENEFFFLKEGQWYQTEKSWIDKIIKWFKS